MKYCEHIAHTLSFNKSDILPCCTQNTYSVPKYYNSKLESHDIVSTINIDEKQQAMLQILNSEDIEKYPCKNCMFCKNVEQLPEDENKINLIFLRQWANDNVEQTLSLAPSGTSIMIDW